MMKSFTTVDILHRSDITPLLAGACSHACMARVSCQAAAYSRELHECRLSGHPMTANNTETPLHAWTEGHEPGAAPLAGGR